MRERFPDGVWFVDLTPLADPALVLPTIARVVGVREYPDRTGRDAGGVPARRASSAVLDNLEHLLAAAPALDALLAACPDLTMLVTSREPLQLRREQVVEVHPCPCPSARRSSWAVADLETVPGGRSCSSSAPRRRTRTLR